MIILVFSCSCQDKNPEANDKTIFIYFSWLGLLFDLNLEILLDL